MILLILDHHASNRVPRGGGIQAISSSFMPSFLILLSVVSFLYDFGGCYDKDGCCCIVTLYKKSSSAYKSSSISLMLPSYG